MFSVAEIREINKGDASFVSLVGYPMPYINAWYSLNTLSIWKAAVSCGNDPMGAIHAMWQRTGIILY